MPDITKIKVADESESSYQLYPRNEEFAKRSGGGSSGVQPDLNQNDDTQPDYVKNRPFYTGDPVVTVLLEEPEAFFQDLGNGECFYELDNPFLLEVGQIYQVSWNGTIYECVGTDYNGDVALGNLSIIDKERQDTGEPFVYLRKIITTTDWSMFHNISISSTVAPITKIDKKYIDVLDKFIVHDNTTITLAEADSYYKKFSFGEAIRLVWCGIIFDSFYYYEHSDGTHTLWLYTNNIRKVVDQNSDGVFSIKDLSEDEIRFQADAGKNSASPELLISKNESVKISPPSYSSSCTSDTLLKIVKNGFNSGQDMEVLGDGTVKAYSIILPSSTPDSTKRFKITVDDSGTLTTTEVT